MLKRVRVKTDVGAKPTFAAILIIMKKFNRKEIFDAVDESSKRISLMSKEERQELKNEIKRMRNEKTSIMANLALFKSKDNL